MQASDGFVSDINAKDANSVAADICSDATGGTSEDLHATLKQESGDFLFASLGTVGKA